MNLLTDSIRPLYFRYLAAAFGSALISSIYGIVDMAMVGQYQGPDGTAALPWSRRYGTSFTASACWRASAGRCCSPRCAAARVCGTRMKTSTLPPRSALRCCSPCFGGASSRFRRAHAAAVRRVGRAAPTRAGLPAAHQIHRSIFPVQPDARRIPAQRRQPRPSATAGVLAGGIFNVFGDWFFVFACDMGIFGAGLATAIGAGISFCVMLTHFFSRRCTLRLVRPKRILLQTQQILVTGFSTFFIDVAMGILTMLFNRQIMRYIGTDGLGGLRHNRQYQHLCPVLRLQRRTGRAAHSRATSARGHGGVSGRRCAMRCMLWRFSASSDRTGARRPLTGSCACSCPRPRAYCRRARHHAQLWHLVPAVAA